MTTIRSIFSKNGFYYPVDLFPSGGFQKIQEGFDNFVERYGEDGRLIGDNSWSCKRGFK